MPPLYYICTLLIEKHKKQGNATFLLFEFSYHAYVKLLKSFIA